MRFFAFVAFFSPFFLAAQDRPLSLHDLMSLADSSSTPLSAARQGVDAAREQRDNASRRLLLPDVRFNAAVGYLGNGYGWGRDSSYSFTVDMPHFSTRFGLEAQQVVYAGGALAAARRQADLAARLSELGYEQQRQDVRLQLAGHYLDLFRSRCQLEVYDSNIALTMRLIDDIHARHEQGTALKNDLTRYELQLATLKMQRLRTENDMLIANSAIVTLAGLPAATRIIPDSSFLAWPLPIGSPSDTALRVRMADVHLSMASEQLRQQQAERFPYVALVAQDQLNGPVTIDINPYDINYNYWFVGLSLNYNLSSLWKNSGTVRAAHRRQLQSQLERQAAAEQTSQAAEAATIRLQEALQNSSVMCQNRELAVQNYMLVADRYANDLALLVDMIDAANTKLQAELDHITARIEVTYRSFVLQYVYGMF